MNALPLVGPDNGPSGGNVEAAFAPQPGASPVLSNPEASASVRLAMLKDVVGLFGTCGNSTWRDPVIARLKELGIESFNPVVPDWTPECADREAEHLATDKVLMFVVTGETEGFGSLGETGWAALAAHRNGQTVVFVIEDFPDGNPKSDANRTRKLVRTHAGKAGFTVHKTVDEALDVVIAAMTH